MYPVGVTAGARYRCDMNKQEMCLGVDVSRYDPHVDWPLLAQQGLAFAIVKLTQSDDWKDPMAAEHLRRANEAGLTTGFYHWCDPMVSAAAQAVHIQRCAYGLPWQFICLDVEQYECQTFVSIRRKPVRRGQTVQTRKMARTVRISASRISQTAKSLVKLLRNSYPACPVVVYTRISFMLEYAPPMLQWIHSVPLWLAQYPDLTNHHLANWSDLCKISKTGLHSPDLPAGCDRWHFWQFSGDRYVLPGSSSRLDLNLFNGSRADLQQFVNTSAERVGV